CGVRLDEHDHAVLHPQQALDVAIREPVALDVADDHGGGVAPGLGDPGRGNGLLGDDEHLARAAGVIDVLLAPGATSRGSATAPLVTPARWLPEPREQRSTL